MSVKSDQKRKISEIIYALIVVVSNDAMFWSETNSVTMLESSCWTMKLSTSSSGSTEQFIMSLFEITVCVF